MTQITLTPEQSRANDAVGEWLTKAEKPWFTIHGYAGTGKTSLAKHFASQQSGRVIYAAYTGKACDVLRKKGCDPVSTIHRLVYLPMNERQDEIAELQAKLSAGVSPDEERRIYRRLEQLQSPRWTISFKSPLIGASLLVLDECSMVDEKLANDLLSFRVPILVLGDPGQLPPIEGSGFFDAQADFMLEEVHRQAAESPVIQLAMKARLGKSLPYGVYGDSRVITRAKVGLEEALGVSQIICGGNKTRVVLNQENRKLRKFNGPLPLNGERLICLRNNEKTSMLNGMMVDLTSDALPGRDATGERVEDSPFVEFETKDNGTLRAYRLNFTKPEAVKAMDYRKRAAADEFDYGYAITGHKSQGSSWPSVLVYADLFRWDRDLFARWCYTALTRAEDRVILAL